MNTLTHGFSIGIERIGSHFFLTLKAKGKLTHADYLKITPFIDAALAMIDDPVVDVLVDGTELSGWEPRAAWDDLKLGLKHGSEFHKIAIYGNKSWQELAAKVAPWFISGEAQYFEDLQEARQWLANETQGTSS